MATQYNLADVLLKEGVSESEKLQRETLATQIRVLGPEDPDTLEPQSNLAGILIEEHRYAEAEKIAREKFDAQLRILGPRHTSTMDTRRQLARTMAYTQRYVEAVKPFQDVTEEENNPSGQGNRWLAWYGLACVAADANRPNDALGYLHEAINRGFEDGYGLGADDDLKSLRPNPKFQQLVTALKHPTTKAQTQ